MPSPLLELHDLHKRFGGTVPAAGISLSIGEGEFFTLLGPSGSGKSTILRIVAGLEQPDSGRVLLKGQDVTAVPPWKRRLGMVFQQYANFPHMSVGENVAYGLRRSGLDRAAIEARVEELLRLVGLAGFAPRRVTQLSGGEQQRVAIARALAPRPVLLLLDEPLAALDEKIRREMQGELRRIQESTGTTFVYVTHDQEEALTLSDRVAVLNRGRCVQCDRPERLFKAPRTPFVASFFRGCNLLRAEVGPGPVLALAGTPVRALTAPAMPGPAPVAIRAENLLLGPDAETAPLRLLATLEGVTYRGLYDEYRLRLADGQKLAAMLTPRPGLPTEPGPVTLGLAPDAVVLLEPDPA
jgi:ABC-type Fe3+/spermidine/putrescine transport system ATPase subunit